MYHPAPAPGTVTSPEEFEYVELRNISTEHTLDLAGVHFAGGLEFSFDGSPVPTLAPGGRVLIVRNLTSFRARYGDGPVVAGQYLGALENAGERILLLDRANEEILDFAYDNQWYPVTDGLGFSLVCVDESAPTDLWSERTQWRPSGRLQGSPGSVDPAPPLFGGVVINEALTHTEQPPSSDSIELWNTGNAPVLIGGWFLSDDFNTPKKFRIPAGITLAAGAYRVFSETDFNLTPGVPPSFSLGADGDEVWLFSANAAGELTGYVHGFQFGPAEDGVSFARQVTSDGKEHFPPQTGRTLGAANGAPHFGPILFTEIHYHPRPVGTNDSTREEYIELHNPGPAPVPLYDPAAPTNTWKVLGGVEFTFPSDRQLAPGATLLLANIDPLADPAGLAVFRQRYQVSDLIPIYGPYSGSLNDKADAVELRRPILLDGTNVAYVLVDEVGYEDESPWPEEADGVGLSLQRRSLTVYGNEPANWFAAAPSAGVVSGSPGLSPSILVQPTSQMVPAATSAEMSVIAQGSAPLQYQWLLNGNNLPGATNASLVLTNVQGFNSGAYQVVVYNSAGAVSSSNATLGLLFPPAILRPPLSIALRGSTNAADYGSTTNRSAIFSVWAYSPSPISYQWRFNGRPLPIPYPGANESTLTITNVTLANDGVYDVVLSDVTASITSTTARLTVLLNPLVVLAPSDQVAVKGGSFTASVVVKGNPPPFTFLWRHTTSNVVTTVSEKSTQFFTRANLQTNHGGLYRVIITNAASPNATIAAAFNVSVLADEDGDGLPDAWEQTFFGSSTAGERNGDQDGDGSLNWQEYVAGTDPINPSSYLHLETLGTNTLRFDAAPNLTYAVDYTDNLGSSPWLRLTEVPARTNSASVQVVDPSPHPTNRVYRLLTPRTP
jgi:hypothetical protein